MTEALSEKRRWGIVLRMTAVVENESAIERLTRAALGTIRRAKSEFLSVQLSVLSVIVCGSTCCCAGNLEVSTPQGPASVRLHVWETHEITLHAQGTYTNPYMDVEVWAELTGPGFRKKVWGFWDGDNTFKIRMMATEPGKWTYKIGASDSAGKALADAGLVGTTGEFVAVDWTEAEKQANPNRRGTIHATPNGHAWQYADGTPFFLLADTWWASATYRYPFKNAKVAPNYLPSETNWSFEGGIQWLKKNGFNSVGIISAHPNWNDDGYPLVVKDDAGVVLRAGKEKSGTKTCRDMHDENGNRPFLFPGASSGKTDVCADFNRINPAYFKNLDKKMDCLQANGFVPYFESVRRDHGQAWKAYYKWPDSFARYLNYLQARYGTCNMIFSLLHYDWSGDSIPASEWLEAMNYWYQKYGPMPFGQPTTTMGAASTLAVFGSTDKCTWLQAHSVGNGPKDHGMELNLAAEFTADPPVPCFCNEPYYINFPAKNNACGGEIPPANSYRDNYLARSHAYGHLLNGGLAGHIVGTGSRWGNTVGEPEDKGNPCPWDTLQYPFMLQAHFLRDFILSEGLKYRELQLASDSLPKRKAPDSADSSLEGWAHMMRTPDKKLAFLYCEAKAAKQEINCLLTNTVYRAHWFNPRTGEWSLVGKSGKLTSDSAGMIHMPPYPGNLETAGTNDWAIKLKAE